MKKRMISVLIAALLSLSLCFGMSAFAESPADNTALLAALGRIESYEAADYTAESYNALAALYEQYRPQAETMESQAEIDLATAQLLGAMSGLKAYLKLEVSANTDAAVSVSYDGETKAAGQYTAVYATPVTVTAPEVDGAVFTGWLETVSKRFLSADSSYTFKMTVNTSLKAIYRRNDTAVLSFRSVAGQVFAEYEKTAAEWALTESIDALIPESVPYRYGYTNGSWAVDGDMLTALSEGESVTVTPVYDTAEAKEWALPSATDDVVLKMHYRYDSGRDVGSFVMKAAVPDGISLQSVGMLFYYKKAESFNPAFDVNNNSKMLVSQYDVLNKDTYITNMKKLSHYSWAVRGYATYEADGKTVMVYSDQVNIIGTEDVHVLTEIAAAAPSCTEDGNTAGTYCDICGTYYGVESIPATGHTQAEAVEENRIEPSCTEAGAYDSVIYCASCGTELSRETVAVPALGHDYTAAVTAPTCTAEGYTVYTCSRCGDTYTVDVTEALGHDMGEWVETQAAVPATCTAPGSTAVETRSCSRCDATETRGGETIAMLDHTPAEAVEENRTEPSCTEAGAYDSVICCANCGKELSRETVSVPALGHNYTAVVTAPTCTAEGYTTYTCNRCGDTYTADITAALGHDMGEWTVVTPAAVGQEGERRRTCSRCDYYESEAIPALTANIETKLPHTAEYLYRAGNANNIAMGSLFKAIDDNEAIDSASVSVTVENIAGNAAGTFTKNSTDWTAGTLKFTGFGVVKLTVKQGTAAVETLYLEIVNGTNYAPGATLANVTSNNAVLLGDVNCKKITINNGKTLYGNSFSVTDTRTDFSGAGNSYITLNGGGSIDNAKLLGTVYPSLITSGQENQYYAPGVWITGDANIYNSYVSETKNAVQIDAGTIYFENTTFAGGALANIDIGGGDVTLKNCITKTTDRGGLKGLGIRAKTASCKIHLLGTFTQYNWLKKSDLPSTFSGVLGTVYNDANYAYSNNGSTYVNMGVFFFTETGSITQAQAAEAIDDKTANTYGYVQKTAAGITATVYTAKASMGSSEALSPAAYDETVNGQYPIPAANSFDYTNKNYVAKTEGSNRYCYYDSTTKQVMISFDKENASSAFSWDPMILTATKNGNTLAYTVSMDGTDYTNRNISFTENGDYIVTYTYTDPYNYGPDGTPFSKTYTKTVEINVVAVEPDTVTYNASFAYDGAAGNYSAKKVIGTDSKTYVMPDVSATSNTIGKTTVAGQTVYYPIVTVNPTTSNGNTAYSSGKIYYFAPVFSELHIIDYNQETGAQQYEYSKNTSTWPHGKSATTGPDTNYFTCASGEKVWSATSPYARSMNSQYYKYGKNNLGVCYTSTEIEKDNAASTHLVQYHYVSNDGTTYYYYIQYKFGAATYSSCVTDGTLVTMADGSQKAIEDVNVGDMVMTWSMWKGCYEAQPVVMRWYHGTDEWRVLTLHFSDGTDVRTIKEHGFFDADKNTYAYITEDNAASYVGDRFIKQTADGGNTTVTLTGYTVSEETVGSYSIQTAFNENFIVENMLSMTGEDYRGRFEYFEIGDGMRYDAAQMQADIEKYGLYSYEDFAEYLTPEQFAMFNGAYFKVLVGKGVLTYEDILTIISTNL